jgi:Tol biopolymer transport system component
LPTISFDGAYVAFASDASDLVAGDTNGKLDAFLYERATAQVQRVGPVEPYQAPEVTNDGGSVVLTSPAVDLVPGDLNGDEDVFLWQRATGTFTAVSAYGPGVLLATPSGDSGPQGISADGRYAVFISSTPNILLPSPQVDTNGDQLDVFLRDRVAGTTVLVSHVPGGGAITGDGWSGIPSLSADGKIVTFVSGARNLVAGPVQTTFSNDIFVYDRTTGEVSLVSHAAGSPMQPAAGDSWNAVVSRDGRFVLFTSFATDLVAGQSDTAGSLDVFLHDRVTGETVLVSHASGSAVTAVGAGAHPVLDAQGRYVAFESAASDLVAGQSDSNDATDVFLYDRTTGTSRLVSHIPSSPSTTGAGGRSSSPSINADGSFVAFASGSPDLVDGEADTNQADDVFLYDTATGTVALASRASDPVARTANGRSFNPVLSGDGRWMAFTSRATDLVPGMIANGKPSLLVFDRISGTLALLSQNVSDYPAVIADDGGTLAYYGDLESAGDGGLILGDRLSGEKVVVSSWPFLQSQLVPAGAIPPLLDADGSVLAFASLAPNLVPDDRNGRWDAFALDRSGGLGGGQSFFTLPPCRVLDSRRPQAGPAFASESPRIVSLLGLCGIPATARAISVNVTVTQATGAGHLTIGSSDRPLPSTSAINFGAGQTRANNAILPLPLNGLGDLRVSATVAGGGTVQVLIDVNGYFE